MDDDYPWPFVNSAEVVTGTTPSGGRYLAARSITLEQAMQAKEALERALAKRKLKPATEPEPDEQP